MLASVWACLTCSRVPSLVINSHNYSIERLLGDGGYAYVYLVTRDGTEKKYALKKIRCMFGGESVANAMREVDACHTFRNSDRVVSCIDSAVVQEADGTKTVYIVLPYLTSGTLQDKINESVVNDTEIPELDVVNYALTTAQALEVMHTHRRRGTVGSGSSTEGTPGSPAPRSGRQHATREEEEELLGHAELDDEDGVSMGDLEPFAHRDVKPANIMFVGGANGSEDVKAVLIDLGSCSPARVDVTTRQQAIELQDMAAEHCTLPFRAPELFDVHTNVRIDEKVDIWGFGCTLYAVMYAISPFERQEQVAGANVNIAIAGGKFSFPETPVYSRSLRDIVSQCLQVDAASRPAIGSVIDMLQQLKHELRPQLNSRAHPRA